MKTLFSFPAAGWLMLFLVLPGCLGGGKGGQEIGLLSTRTTGVYRAALQAGTIEGYYKFLRASPDDPNRKNGIKKLVALLNKNPDKLQLIRFAKKLPLYGHLIQDSLRKLEIQDRIYHRINDLEYLNPPYQFRQNSSSFTLTKGEPFYGFRYAKVFVGLADIEEEERIFTYELEYQRIPPWFKIELDHENSICYAQRYNSYANIKYLVWLAKSAPDGEYSIQVTFALYSQIGEEDPKERVGDITVTHKIKQRQPVSVSSVDDVEFYASLIKFYRKKRNEAQNILKKMVEPTGNKFAPFYLYERYLSETKFNLRRYDGFQKIGLIKLIEASRSDNRAVKDTASDRLASFSSSGVSIDKIAKIENIPFDVTYEMEKLPEGIVVRDDTSTPLVPVGGEIVEEMLSEEDELDEAMGALDELLSEDEEEIIEEPEAAPTSQFQQPEEIEEVLEEPEAASSDLTEENIEEEEELVEE